MAVVERLSHHERCPQSRRVYCTMVSGASSTCKAWCI